MRANVYSSLLNSLNNKINEELVPIVLRLKMFFFNKSVKSFHPIPFSLKIALPVLFLMLLSGFQARSADTIVSVKFANPKYVCSTQTYTLEVQFQCNVSGLQLYGINARFFYADDVLEFSSFSDCAASYRKTGITQLIIWSADSAMNILGITGPSAFINGKVQKYYDKDVFIPTSSWVRLFNINFHVDDPEIMNDPDFCPSVIWDKQEYPLQSGMYAQGGVVINLVTDFLDPGMYSCLEHVYQFNWQYDTIPGEPFGFPVSTKCISTLRTYAPRTSLPFCTADAQGVVNVPVTVTNFDHIGHFNLVFEYDPAVMIYNNNTPNAIFNTQHGLLNVTDSASTDGKKKITMKFQALLHMLSLPDSSSLAVLHFNLISGTTELAWKTINTTCHYVDTLSQVKCDQPYPDYYINGGLLAALAPITKIDSNVAFVGNYVTYGVKVWNFTNIHSGMLTLDYDPAVLVYYETVCNAAYTGIFETTVLYQGRLQMGWTGNDTSLTDESVLAYLTFEYVGGEAPLLWFDDGTSCEYVNCQEVPLEDEPMEEFYINGSITSAEFIWTGINSSDWNNSSNWANNVVPDQFTNVSIDPSSDPGNWPAFNGNFTLGVNCNNLTINDNAQLSISGDFTINPGHTLSFNGPGTLHIGGDWTNSGIFNAGDGTVEFTGSSDGIIDHGVPPGNYVAAYVLSTFPAGMTPVTGGSAGPTGNNNHLDVAIGFAFNYLGQNYSQLRINTNGWVSLNLSGDDITSEDNTILFNSLNPGTALAPWWDDLNADASSAISYKCEGVAPSRVFTAEWKNILAFSSGSTVRLNFQVKLYETSNIIEFCYGNVVNDTHNLNESASIGIKDATGGPGNFIEATHNSSSLIIAFLKSGTDWPVVNFRFSPPVESDMDVFNKLINSKSGSTLYIQHPVTVAGTN